MLKLLLIAHNANLFKMLFCSKCSFAQNANLLKMLLCSICYLTQNSKCNFAHNATLLKMLLCSKCYYVNAVHRILSYSKNFQLITNSMYLFYAYLILIQNLLNTKSLLMHAVREWKFGFSVLLLIIYILISRAFRKLTFFSYDTLRLDPWGSWLVISRPFWAIAIHSRPFPSISIHLRPFPVIPEQTSPFMAILGHSRQSPAIYGHYW